MTSRRSTSGSVAVIGAGVAGLACGRHLDDRGDRVVLFDRGRGPGGRMATRHVSGPHDETRAFDHGAPFFSPAGAEFARAVRSWCAEGVCADWDPRVATWQDGVLSASDDPIRPVVGVPGMSAVRRHLARGLDVQASAAVTRLDRRGRGWMLEVDPRHGAAPLAGPFDAVVVAAPAQQALRLVDAHSPPLAATLAAIEMEPVWVELLCVRHRLDPLPDVIDVVADDVVARLIRDDAKPGRSAVAGHSRWVAHASSAWSARRYDAEASAVDALLARAAVRILAAAADAPLDATDVSFSRAHRWGFAHPRNPVGAACVADDAQRLVVCGDGFGGSGVEAAFLSGKAAARHVNTGPPIVA